MTQRLGQSVTREYRAAALTVCHHFVRPVSSKTTDEENKDMKEKVKTVKTVKPTYLKKAPTAANLFLQQQSKVGVRTEKNFKDIMDNWSEYKKNHPKEAQKLLNKAEELKKERTDLKESIDKLKKPKRLNNYLYYIISKKDEKLSLEEIAKLWQQLKQNTYEFEQFTKKAEVYNEKKEIEYNKYISSDKGKQARKLKDQMDKEVDEEINRIQKRKDIQKENKKLASEVKTNKTKLFK